MLCEWVFVCEYKTELFNDDWESRKKCTNLDIFVPWYYLTKQPLNFSGGLAKFGFPFFVKWATVDIFWRLVPLYIFICIGNIYKYVCVHSNIGNSFKSCIKTISQIILVFLYLLTVIDLYVAQIPQCTSPSSHNAPLWNRNVHVCTFLLQSGALWEFACIVGFLRWVYNMVFRSLLMEFTVSYHELIEA